MEIKYRKAEKSDIKSLIDLRIELNYYDCEQEGTKIENEEQLRKNIEKTLREELNKTIYFFVAIDNEKIIADSGIIIQKVLPFSTIMSGKIGYITSVYTYEKYRRKGIQKKLINMAIEFAKDNGAERIELNADNPYAVTLYETFGFKRYGSKFRLVLK